MAHRKLLTALLTIGLLLSTTTAASATTAPSKSLEVVSETGDFVGQGLEYAFTGSDARFEAYQSFNTQAWFRVLPRDGGFWVVHFGAPIGQRLVPGTYDGALRSNTFSEESPMLDIGGNGRGCNQSFGSFVVNDARFDGLYGDVIGFDASFEFHCERMDAPALRGHIHYSVDSTPPVLVPSIDPAPNAEGWNTTAVVVTWTVSDPESGIAWEDCAPTTISHETYAHGAFCRAQNGDGRISFGGIAVHIDKTAPSISTDRTPANVVGWNSSDVTVNVSCSDALSGVASCDGSQTVAGEGAGQSVLATATDRAGNLSSVIVRDINIDRTAPTVAFGGNAGSYGVDQIIDITCRADDLISGIAAALCPAIAAVPATNYVGATKTTTTTMAASAMDNAGNTAAATTAFTVTVTADGICGLTENPEPNQAVCALVIAIAEAPNAQVKAGALTGLDRYLAAQRGRSISADRADLLGRLAHLL
jgi:hypothetical protein